MAQRGGASGVRVGVGMLLALVAGLARGEEAPGAAWLGVWLGRSATESGALVSRVFVESPAEAAGLRGRDRIVSIDGETVASPEELIAKVRAHDAGAWLSFGVVRQGRELDVDARLVARPAEISSRRVIQGFIGVEAIDLPATLREHFGAPAEAGVMVSAVAEESAAEAAGLRLGDVIYEVDGEPVRSLAELRELIAGAGVGNTSELRVARDGAELELETLIDRAPLREKP